jgi:DNA-binding PadR family transcriptional regulator
MSCGVYRAFFIIRAVRRSPQQTGGSAMSTLRIAILKMIKANDGKFSWYQLDRALTRRAGGVDPGVVSKDLMSALRELEQEGFITTRRPAGRSASRQLSQAGAIDNAV